MVSLPLAGEERIAELLPELDKMIGGSLITLERARVVMYRPNAVRDSQVELHCIDGVDGNDSNRACP